MKVYKTNEIRNVAILGHLGSGKTTLAESLLHVSGALSQKGSVDAKNSVSDHMDEEKQKQGSLSTSLIPVIWKNSKINFLDVPGTDEFDNELKQSLSVVKGAVLVVDANRGVEIGTENHYKLLRKMKIPTIILATKLDKENADYEKTLKGINDVLGSNAVSFVVPIGKEENFKGYVDCVSMVAREQAGKEMKEVAIPSDLEGDVAEKRETILEAVAESSEELLEKYFGGEELTQEEIDKALSKRVKDGDLVPVIAGSAEKNIGVGTLLDMIVKFFPTPNELPAVKGKNPKTNAEEERKASADSPFSAYVFKTVVDPFVGAINYIKVLSGTLKTGQEIHISNTNDKEKVGALFTSIGKKQEPLDEVHAGDICAVSKLEGIQTGYTLSDLRSPILYPPVEILKPTIYVAISPKERRDEDRISTALTRLSIEDPSFETVRNVETNQLLLGGLGMTHINYIIDRMKSLYKVDIVQEETKVVYRETIKKKVEAEGKHKKQSGGAGQFGHVFIRFEPTEEDFVFAEEIFGGAVPKNYFPAVEKGLIETFQKGPLAGFPVIGVKATLYDGSYHSVDSNEISFKMAANLAFREAVKTAQPTILEPILKMEIFVKDQYVGDVMGDMNKRRGRVLGMVQSEDGMQTVEVEVPESEVLTYTIDLKAMTQGSGTFQREFLRYEEVPDHLIPGIIQKYKEE